MLNLLAAANPTEHVVDHLIFSVHGFWILSNHIVMLLTAGIIMLLVFPAITKPYRDGEHVPTGTRNFVEALMLFIRNDVAKPLLADETDRFMPFLWTLFFFILTCNVLGLIPFDAIQNLLFGRNPDHHFHAISGTATSNIFVTITLALIVFVVIQFQGIKANGFGGWMHHFLGGAPWWLAPVMVPVEILGMLMKPFALAVRLAANMTAGHLLLAVLIGFVPEAWAITGAGGGLAVACVSIVSAIAIMVLELFVACLQAYLFVFLSALFISQLITHHHDENHNDEREGHEFAATHAVREHDSKIGSKVKPAY